MVMWPITKGNRLFPCGSPLHRQQNGLRNKRPILCPGTKSASSLRAASSKIRRGFVGDSLRTARGRSRYSVAVFVFMDCSPLSGWVVQVGGVSGRPDAARMFKPWLAGLRHIGFRFFGGFCQGFFEGREDHSGSLLDDFQALDEQGRVAVVEVDVIGIMLSST